MPIAMTSGEARDQFDSLLSQPSFTFDAAIVEHNGEPRAVIVSFAEYQDIIQLREARRQEQVIDELSRINATLATRNLDLTDEQIEEIAVRAGREVLDAVIAKHVDQEPVKA